MKKRLIALVLVALAVACLFAGCTKNKDENKFDVDYDAFFTDDFRDYENDIHLNVATYPELARQGLRLVTPYGDSYRVPNEAVPDEQAIGKYFDLQKGILVIVNGLQIGVGRNKNVHMQSDSRTDELRDMPWIEDIEYFTKDENSWQTYDLGKYWYDNGYNVFYFHWEMFADNDDTVSAPDEIKEKIWTRDSGVQAMYMRNGTLRKTEPGEAVNGSLAEWFAGEYLRMVSAVRKAFPEYEAATHDVRFAGHSMGGVLTAGSAALLTLLADAGEMPKAFAPNRLAFMDSYLGISGSLDYTIAWSGKKYPSALDANGDRLACNVIAAIKMMVEEYGVAAEFCTNEGFVVPFMNIAGLTDLGFDNKRGEFTGHNSEYANAVLELCPIVQLAPYFRDVEDPIMFNGHNAVREWYLSSILYDAPLVGETVVPTARMSDKDVRAHAGQFFTMRRHEYDEDNEYPEYSMYGEYESVRCDDDTFVLGA